jgi:hypothetical protein
MNPLRTAAGLFPGNIFTLLPAAIAVLFILTTTLYVRGQENPNGQAEPTPQPQAAPESEEDPTQPLVFSIRNEYRDLKNGGWANTVIFRTDKLSFRNFQNRGGAKGLLLRLDIPWNTVHIGTRTKSGPGDVYGQVLYIPHATKRFATAIGTGVVLPTASHDLLGRGKLILAPSFIPVWYFSNRKRLTFIRIQNYFSVAGKSSRPDVNYLLVDPNVVIPVTRRWWIGLNTEFTWNWKTSQAAGISGFQVGRIISRKFGFWIKPEIPFGPARTGGFNLKFIVFRVR